MPIISFDTAKSHYYTTTTAANRKKTHGNHLSLSHIAPIVSISFTLGKKKTLP